MRYLSPFERSLMVAAPLAWTLTLCAHARPKQAIELERTKITAPSKVGNIQTKNQINRTAIGERFQLWLSINPSDCNDPVLLDNAGKDDHKFDLYGKLTVNGVVQWEEVRNTSTAMLPFARLNLPATDKIDPRKDGLSLNQKPHVFMAEKRGFKVSTRTGDTAKSTVHLSLQLFDQDNPTGGFDYNQRDQAIVDRQDDHIGDYNIDLDLSKLGMSDGRYYWFWNSKDESGNPIGTNLYLMAEHVGTVYESVSNGRPKPHVDPKIIDKKFPGRVPVPGPVIIRTLPFKTKSSH